MEAVASDIALKRRAEAKIMEAIDGAEHGLLNGIAIDYADYRGRAGEIKGLRAALVIMTEVADQMMGKTEGNNGGS